MRRLFRSSYQGHCLPPLIHHNEYWENMSVCRAPLGKRDSLDERHDVS